MRRYRILTCGALLLTVTSFTANARGEIVPPNATYRGRTYQQWQVKYWQDLFATPVVNGRHPFFTGDVFGGQDEVHFLWVGQTVPGERNLTMSADAALFFDIVAVESSVFEPPPDHGDDEASLRANANMNLDNQRASFVQIDGVTVDLAPFRIETPLFEWGPLPENNLFQSFGLNAPAGTTSPAIGAGYFLLLEPLSVGQHVINIGPVGASPDITFNITVVPEPASIIMLAAAAMGGFVFYRPISRHDPPPVPESWKRPGRL
jgi:hypothetical protein